MPSGTNHLASKEEGITVKDIFCHRGLSQEDVDTQFASFGPKKNQPKISITGKTMEKMFRSSFIVKTMLTLSSFVKELILVRNPLILLDYLWVTFGQLYMPFFLTYQAALSDRVGRISVEEARDNTIENPPGTRVWRDENWKMIMEEELLPGDVVFLENGLNSNKEISSDLIILFGEASVSEAMLTGESDPKAKQSLTYLCEKKAVETVTFEVSDLSGYESQLIRSGSRAIFFGCDIELFESYTQRHDLPFFLPKNESGSAICGCLCLVVRTGNYATKGILLAKSREQLVREIHISPEIFGIGVIFFLLQSLPIPLGLYPGPSETSPRLVHMDFWMRQILSSVPTSLFTERAYYSNLCADNLRKKFNIICTDSERILESGKVEICCFDKTGTLTENIMVVKGIVCSPSKDAIENPVGIKELNFISARALAICHSLKLVGGELIGQEWEKDVASQLADVGWKMLDSETVRAPKCYSSLIFKRVVNKCWDFRSSYRRATTVVKVTTDLNDYFMVFVKGKPSTLDKLFSHNEKQMQHAYEVLASEYGYRVFSLGYKRMPFGTSISDINGMEREDLESNLHFGGLICLESQVRNSTIEHLSLLRQSGLQIKMITGDSLMTAVNVAKKVDIINNGKINLVLLPRSEEPHNTGQYI